jgi:tRNA threonylcarbamoyladenosine biosynthesis protein TsaB
MKLLAIDTATEACSAALACDDDIIERYEVAPRRHAELILPMVQSLLDEAQFGIDAIDAVAFGRGPGAFTGLRIAAGIAQGIAWAVDKPVVPVSTLAAMALGASREFDASRLL